MSDTVSFKANAKLNLNLDITGISTDRKYHTVEMVMQSIDLHDTVTVTACTNEISVNCNEDEVPQNEENIAYKAAQKFFEFANINSGSEIKIKKRIPCAAGLGGGSADAAAVIVALNELYKTGFEKDELCEIASDIGSDVPFFISGGTQLAEGRGTILTPLPDLPECYFVIVKDGIKPSTGEMYRRFESKTDIVHPETNLLVESICEGNLLQSVTYMGNVFESLWDDSILKIKDKMKELGAIHASLSGSGPSIFGIFLDENTASDCKDKLQDLYENVYLCEPSKKGIE